MDAALEHAQSDEPQDDNKASLVGNKAETANPQIIQTDSQEEKKLLHKMDFYLMPAAGLLYLLCFLDRVNIGNALTAGMVTDLGLTDNQKAAIISLLYATYVTFECVWPVLIKLITPKITMAVSLVSFGVVTLAHAWAGNYGGFVALRLLLGVTEAGVFPCIVVYFSMTYRREELGLRLSFLFVSAAISGGFGGLIAFGIAHIKSGALSPWQYIFLVEGAITISFAPLIFLWIPNRVDEAWFFNKRERELCAIRYKSNTNYYSHVDKLEWKYIIAAALDWTTYAHGTAQFPINVALYGISTFMPTFIRDFGFDSVTAQILTVPVYAVGAISFVIQAYFSDKLAVRGPFILANMVLCLIGYIILAAVEGPTGVKYFALFIVSLGMYTPVGLNIGWTQANHAPHYKRAFAVGMMQLMGNSSGAAVGYIYFDEPRYVKGFATAIALCVVGMLSILVLMWHYHKQNGIKTAVVAAGATNQQELGDKNPHYQYLL